MDYPKFFYDNRFSDVTPTASTTAAGSFAAANVADMRPYTWWKPTALPAYVRVDGATAHSANYAVCHSHNLFTHGCTFEVRGSTDNFATSDVLVATKTPTSDDPFLLEFVSASYRYWEFKITGGATMPSIAIAMIGLALEMPIDFEQGFDPIGRDLVCTTNVNDNGWPLGRIIDYSSQKQTLVFSNVTNSWLRTTFLPAWNNYLRGEPVMFAWDSANYPAEIYLRMVGDKFSAPHNSQPTNNLSFDVSGVA